MKRLYAEAAFKLFTELAHFKGKMDAPNNCLPFHCFKYNIFNESLHVALS